MTDAAPKARFKISKDISLLGWKVALWFGADATTPATDALQGRRRPGWCARAAAWRAGPDALHAGLVVDLIKKLQRLDAELAGLLDFSPSSTQTRAVSQVAGALLSRFWLQCADGLLKDAVCSIRLGREDVDLTLEAAGQARAVVVAVPP